MDKRYIARFLTVSTKPRLLILLPGTSGFLFLEFFLKCTRGPYQNMGSLPSCTCVFDSSNCQKDIVFPFPRDSYFPELIFISGVWALLRWKHQEEMLKCQYQELPSLKCWTVTAFPPRFINDAGWCSRKPQARVQRDWRSSQTSVLLTSGVTTR